jgi:hypothetical protein
MNNGKKLVPESRFLKRRLVVKGNFLDSFFIYTMSLSPSLTQRLLRGDLSIIFYMSLFKTIIHLLVNWQGGYGLFRDELYYIACADNIAAGYVDQPPLSVIILRGVIAMFGDSLFAVRLMPAIAAGLMVFFTGLMAREMGARGPGVFLACLFALGGINLALFSFYSMNAFEVLTWTIAAYMVLVISKEGKPHHWLILGLVLGFGLLNKIGVLFIGAGIFVGLIATKDRKWLATPWPYVAGGIALLLFLPYILWNIQNDFAHLEFIHNASSEKYSSLSPITFVVGQIMANNPVGLLIWLPGLVALFMNRQLKQFSWLGYLYLVPLIILLVNGTSKVEYLAGGYGVLWAAGSTWWEQRIVTSRAWKFALSGITALWIFVTLMFVPMLMPVLPVDSYVAYAEALNFQPESPEGKEQSQLPQFYADMFGWREKADAVGEVYQSLPDHEKARCAIFSNNYGRCGAIDYYGRKFGLPKAIGNHNNYWIWGTRGHDGSIVIILGGDEDDHRQAFREVSRVTTVDCEYCMPYEDNVPVYVCRGITQDLDEIWKSEKHFE